MESLTQEKREIVLIGAGIMSATLGMLIKKLDPSMHLRIYERLPVAGAESSDPWNNAGTGHSAFCELNYTPEKEDGSIDISKAIKIAESFEESKEFWSFLATTGVIKDPREFIHRIPHMTFVNGEENVKYLQKRQEALKSHPLFSEMVYIDDKQRLFEMVPLMMEGRDTNEKIAATCMDIGTDVNFGSLTHLLLHALEKMEGVTIHFQHEVKDLEKTDQGRWNVRIANLANGSDLMATADFVFIGAGGRALSLLENSGIEEGKGFGGFPVSGQWLICKNREVIERHHAKVYGKAAIGSPPMSVPHLDSRVILEGMSFSSDHLQVFLPNS